MASKVRFPLKMTDGAEVRTLEEFKEHFDIESAVKYFSDGSLLVWLRSRYYDEEADKISKLSKDDAKNFYKELCMIFGIESVEAVDPELIAWRKERLNRLTQYTRDENILANVDKVAFDQEDLADLLDEGAEEIYLCANRFVIPLRMKNKVYIGVKDAVAVIRRKEPVDFGELGIKFKNVAFDDDYQKILPKITAKNVSEPVEIQTYTEEATVEYSHYCRGVIALSKIAPSFVSDIKLISHYETIDAKNFFQATGMRLTDGDLVKIVAIGSDAREAVMELKKYLKY